MAQSDRTLLAIALVLFVWGVSVYQSVPETPPDARIAQLQARLAATEAELAKAQATADKAAHVVNTSRARLDAGDSVMRIGMRRAKAVVADSTTSLDTLRMVLARTIEKAERYQADVLRYQESVDSLLIAHVRERQSLAVRIDTMQAVIDAQEAALMPCTRFGVRCPSRLQSLAIGFALAIAVVVVL